MFSLDAILTLPLVYAPATYPEDGGPRREGTIMADDAQTTEQTGNGHGLWGRLYDLAARLRLVERAIERHEQYGPRLEAVERDISAIRGEVVGITTHLSQQDRDAAQRQQAEEERTTGMMQQLSAMQALTTETTRQSKLYQAQIGSLDAHRKQHAAEQDTKMDALAQDITDLKEINAARAKIEDDAKALATQRHAEQMSAAKDMRNSFNVVYALVPGIVVWLAQGGFHASAKGALEAGGATALVIAWGFVPAFTRWLRLKFGR